MLSTGGIVMILAEAFFRGLLFLLLGVNEIQSLKAFSQANDVLIVYDWNRKSYKYFSF